MLSLFAYCFELLRAVTAEVAIILRENLSRDEVAREGLLVELAGESEAENVRCIERQAMMDNDQLVGGRDDQVPPSLTNYLLPYLFPSLWG